MTTSKRTAIERAAKRLCVTIEEPLIEVLEQFEANAVGPKWTFSLPPAWQLLSEIVHDDFSQVWTGPAGIVVGESMDGDLVCLIEKDGVLDPAVQLLRHESLTLEQIATDLDAFSKQSDDDVPAFDELDDDEDDEPRPEDDFPPLSEKESMGLAAALGRLLSEPEPEPEPLNPALVASIEKALDALILQELLELDGARRPALVEELCASTGEARTPKALLRRFVRCLVDSDHPEEVYGTDADLESAVRGAWS